ncbi:TetR/AcrR family transcriptional regulator [Stenotrophomonas rhizophila]|uniref:TetR/AcrR family transcriptional regulator n=1 Tax=Stenotrophomonas rhizophila TaxID=216778 RepID=UPI001E390131|nr:TetR/AcrR family transcriptional regulator [Stenotrophomonas rhizophila]MCC7635178.1 TetR/AcrR family transcriptional regulator [Stenotrophomonas rhizophila]MCC7664607.1 TetR/AcrR family transcriptional regulator [Stenotrophomonas rhizophila]
MALEPRAQRWDRIRSERREQILEAASRAFARHGVDTCSMGLIAAECEATKVTLYAHFRSKQLLAAAVLQRWLASVERAVGAIGSDTAGLHDLLWSMAQGLEQVTRSDAYRALSRAVHQGEAVPAHIMAGWERRFDRQRTQLEAAFSASGSPDAGLHAEVFLTLLDRMDSLRGAGAVIRLFLAAYRKPG